MIQATLAKPAFQGTAAIALFVLGWARTVGVPLYWLLTFAVAFGLGTAFAYWRIRRSSRLVVLEANRADVAESTVQDIWEADHLPLMQVDHLSTGVIQRVTGPFLDLFGLEANIVGTIYGDYIYPPDLEKTIAVVEHSLATGERIEDFENRWNDDPIPVKWIQLGTDGRTWMPMDLRPLEAERQRANTAQREIRGIRDALLDQAAPAALSTGD